MAMVHYEKHAVAGDAINEHRPLRMVKKRGSRKQGSYVTLRVETIGNNAVYVLQGSHLEGVCTTSAEDAVGLFIAADVHRGASRHYGPYAHMCLERARRHKLRGSKLMDIEDSDDEVALLQLLRGAMTSTVNFPLRA